MKKKKPARVADGILGLPNGARFPFKLECGNPDLKTEKETERHVQTHSDEMFPAAEGPVK